MWGEAPQLGSTQPLSGAPSSAQEALLSESGHHLPVNPVDSLDPISLFYTRRHTVPWEPRQLPKVQSGLCPRKLRVQTAREPFLVTTELTVSLG